MPKYCWNGQGMGSCMRLERCSTARFDPGVRANIPEHAAVTTFSSGQWLRDFSKAQPCAGVKVQVERERKCGAAAGEGWQGAAEAHRRLQRAQRGCKERRAARAVLSGPRLGALSKAQPTVRVRIREGCSLWHRVSKHFSAINNLPFVIFQGTLCLYNYWNTYVVDRWS